MNTEFASDIPFELARAAHLGTSHVPDERATQERDGYAAELGRDHAALAKLATTDEKRAALEVEFARYRQGYRTRYLALLTAKSRCLSTMITGRSGFNVRRAEKASSRADKRTADLLEYRDRALKAIRQALQPELAPIMLGDSDAAARIREKILVLERDRDFMKASNGAIRKNAKAGPDAQVAALVLLGRGLTAERARSLLAPDFCGRIGFAPFELTNRGAEIRRLQARLTVVERNHASEPATIEGERARLEDCPAENRVRLFFPDKPDADTRAALKHNGFRWAPSLGCWQAYRNHHSIEHARNVAA